MGVEGKFGTMFLHNGKYQVLQFHFHFPSEHTIKGKPFAGELHIVFQREGSTGTDDLAFVAIMLNVPVKAPAPPPSNKPKSIVFHMDLRNADWLDGANATVNGDVAGAIADAVR